MTRLVRIEVLREDAIFNPMLCDIWALGVILFLVLTGGHPFDVALATDPRFALIAEGRLQELVDFMGVELSPAATDLLQALLRPDPLQRLTLTQILEHPWMA